MDPEWRCLNFLWLKMGDVLLLWWFTRVLFSPSFPIKIVFLDRQEASSAKPMLSKQQLEEALRGCWWCVRKWLRLCYLVVFGRSYSMESMGGASQFPWKGGWLCFFPRVLPFYPKKTHRFCSWNFEEDDISSCATSGRLKMKKKTLQSYSVITQIWSMLWVWC